MNMNLSQRDRRTLVLGSIALSVILLAYFVVIPVTEDWRTAREQIASARAQLDRLEIEARLASDEQHQIAERFGPGAVEPLPSLVDARLAFVKQVEAIMDASGVSIQSINPQPARNIRDRQGLTLVPLQVEGECDLEDLAEALDRMRRSERLIIVQRVQASENGNSNDLNVNLVLATLASADTAP